MIKSLTDRFVAGVRCATRDNFFDTQERGLVLRVGPRTKAWYFTYRNGGGSEWFRLGQFPALSLADARAAALQQRKAIEIDGLDPAVERRTPPPPPPAPDAQPREYTFADFVPVFVAFQKGRIKTWKDDEQKIAKHLAPTWNDRPLASITRRDVQDLLDTVQQRGLKEGTNRVQALVSRIFTIALDKGRIDAHPVARMIKRYKEHPRDKALTDAELRSLWTALDAQPGAAADAVRLRALLGQRGDETVGMRWSELDLQAAIWALPARRTKNGRAHAVGLPPTALAILTQRRAAVPDDEPRVFPGLTLTGDEHKALTAIHGDAYTWKDLRRTLATRLADLSFDETVIGRTLNHAKYGVTGKIYNQHVYTEEIRRALTAWDTELQRVLANQPKKRAAVLPMNRRAR